MCMIVQLVTLVTLNNASDYRLMDYGANGRLD